MRKTAARLLSKKDRQPADDGDRTKLRAILSGGLTPTVAQRLIGGEVTVTAMPYLEEAYALDEDEIGNGQSAMVYAATRRSDQGRVALKVIELAKLTQHIDHVETVRAEVRALSSLPEHPSVVRLHAVLCTASELALELELLPDGDLLAPIEEQDAGFQEADCARIFAQLAAAVAHLHAHGWAHRDIKPENVCLAQRDDGAVAAKLVDFGSAAPCEPGERTLRGLHGTPEYVAPEVSSWHPGLSGGGRCELYGCEADIWSMGVTLYVMLSGRAPWPQRVPQLELIALIRGDDAIRFDAPAWALASEEARALVLSLLHRRPGSRPSAAAVCAIPWVANGAAAEPRPTLPAAVATKAEAAEMEAPALPAAEPALARRRLLAALQQPALDDAAGGAAGLRVLDGLSDGELLGRAASAVDALCVKAEDDARAHAEALEQARAVAQDAIAVAAPALRRRVSELEAQVQTLQEESEAAAQAHAEELESARAQATARTEDGAGAAKEAVARVAVEEESLRAELAHCETACEDLRSTLVRERASHRAQLALLTRPLEEELSRREAERQEAEAALQIELQAKRHRVAVAEAAVDAMKSRSGREEARAAAAEAALAEAQAALEVARRQRPAEPESAAEVVSPARGGGASLHALAENLALRRQLALQQVNSGDSSEALRAAVVAVQRRANAEVFALASELRAAESASVEAGGGGSGDRAVPSSSESASALVAECERDWEARLAREIAAHDARAAQRTAEAARAARQETAAEWAEKLKQAVLLTRAVVQRGPDAPTHAAVAAGSGERRVGSGASATLPSKRAPEPEARLALVRGLGKLTWAA